MAVKIANDKEIEDAFLQLKAEADAASGSPPIKDLSAKMSEIGQQMREKVRANALSSVRQTATQVVLQRGARRSSRP